MEPQLAVCAHDVQDGIDDLLRVVLSGMAGRVARQQGLQDLPFFVGQVAQVRFPYRSDFPKKASGHCGKSLAMITLSFIL